MIIERIPFEIVKEFTRKDKQYQTNPNLFRDFIQFLPEISGLKNAVEERKNFPVNRKLLIEVFRKQYSDKSFSQAQSINLDKLSDENTFTIITAHQPALFGGPLYYFTKILSIIRLAEILNSSKDNFHIIPIFINGAEDHDFEEVNHCNLFGNRIEWTKQSGGPVGRLDTDGLNDCLNAFCELLGKNENASKIENILRSSLEKSVRYKDFVARFLHEIFSEYGLLILDMDDDQLKAEFMHVMLEEITDNPSEALILDTQNRLQANNFKPQAHPREINIFYMEDQLRERFVRENDRYKVLNTNLEFDITQLKDLATKNPNKFSPNVIIRPLYQEFTLPNIAYIGGGGELAYWLERKTQFNHFGIFFPVLIRRNSIMIMNKPMGKQVEKLSLNTNQLFEKEDQIINEFLQTNTDFDIKLTDEILQIDELLDRMVDKAGKADATLRGFAEAEKIRILKQLENVENRITRSLKKQEEVKINQISSLKNKLFPNMGLQERYDNFFQFYVQYEGDLISDLLPHMNPLDREFLVFRF